MVVLNAGLTDVAMASFKNAVWDMSPEEIVNIRNKFGNESTLAVDTETRVETYPHDDGVTYFAQGSFHFNSTTLAPSTIGYTTTDGTSMVVDVSWSFADHATTQGNLKIKGFTYTSIVDGDSITQSVKFDAWTPSSKPFTNVVFTVSDTTVGTTTQKLFGTVKATDFGALFSKGIDGHMNLTWTEMQAYADAHSYTIDMSKSLTDQTMDGSNVNDKLIGGAGNDSLTGGAGDDSLTGGAGNDSLDGGTGNDKMTGGFGDDTYYVDSLTDKVIESAGVGSGTDTVHTTVTLATLFNNVENVTLDGTADLNVNGNKLVNTIIGNDGANILNGKEGNDTLTGGAGNDIFVFNTKLNTATVSNVDTITDFTSGEDTIQLENAIFKKLLATGPLDAANFNASADGSAAGANTNILYNTTTGELSYDADGSGAGVAIQIAIIGSTIHPTLSAADFTVI